MLSAACPLLRGILEEHEDFAAGAGAGADAQVLLLGVTADDLRSLTDLLYTGKAYFGDPVRYTMY